MKKFKVVWINLLMKCEYDADLKNGKRAEFTTYGAAESWARRQNRKDGVITGLLREYRVEPIEPKSNVDGFGRPLL